MHIPQRLLQTTFEASTIIILCVSILGVPVSSHAEPQTFNSLLEYLEAIQDGAPATTPLQIFALASLYNNANEHERGIQFFDTFITGNDAQMSSRQKAWYRAALGLVRGSFTTQLPFPERPDWVTATLAIVDTAKSLANDEFFVRWGSGIFRSQLPDFFLQTDTAIADLQWSIDNIDKAPHPGFLRETYFRLGSIFDSRNDPEQAQRFLALSGFDSFEKEVNITTSIATNLTTGATFHPRKLVEIISGRVFALSGFDFSELYFIVSENQQELIAIDAGTRPDSLQAGFDFLNAQFPNLPDLTTVFVTHSHWDHIGGHLFFRDVNPSITFYARDNYEGELERALNVPVNFRTFFGTEFSDEFIAGFVPEQLVTERTTVEIDGTQFDLIPIDGGETEDGMFVYLPQHAVLFVGDFIMPFIGAPFLEEGNIPGLFDAIGTVVTLDPTHILHGHEPLTRIFSSPTILDNLKRHLEWLQKKVLKQIRKGKARAKIHRKNFIPPFINETPEIRIQYLVLRENFINRLYDQNVGYWQPDLQGMDHLSEKELGAALVHYLGLTETQLASAVDDMVNNGDHELAGRIVTIALTQFPESEALEMQKTRAFLKLKERYQQFNPFKFYVYSDVISDNTPQLVLE